jgi:hypothetical protein
MAIHAISYLLPTTLVKTTDDEIISADDSENKSQDSTELDGLYYAAGRTATEMICEQRFRVTRGHG